MESPRKHLITKWLNVFLLVINISAFVTLLLLNEGSVSGGINTTESEPVFNSDDFLKEELGLTEEQYDQIVKLDAQVFRTYQMLLDLQCESNFILLDELSADAPSKHKLDSIASRVGSLHTSMKRQTIRHFQNVKSICNEEQKVLLNNLLKDMMELGDQCKYCNKKECARRERLKKIN